jgi:pimeloyl-ACP methyl ester carboxylesterase
VYGVSYGTMWTQRYAALYPTQATAIILDGVVTLSGGSGRRLTFDRWESNMDQVMRRMLAVYCPQNHLCNNKLGPDPLQFAEQVFDKLYGSSQWCAAVTADPSDGGLGVNRDLLRNLFGICATSHYLRQLIPGQSFRGG